MNGLSHRIVIVLLLGTPVALRAQTPHLDALRQKNLGVAYLEQRQTPAAEAAFQKVVQLQPEEALGYVNLAMCCLRSGRLDEAQMWAERARQRAPRNPEILLRVAEVLLSSGDLSQAVGVFESVLEVEPENLMAHYGVVVALGSGDKHPSARRRVAQHVQTLYELAPNNVAVAVRGALESLQSGDSAGAQRILRAMEPLVDDLASVQDVYGKSLEAVRADQPDAVNQLRKLTNSLTPTARYRQALAELQPPIMGIPVERFSDPFYTALQRERPLPRGTTFRPFEVRQGPLPLHDRSPVRRGTLDAADIDGDGREDVLASVSTDDGGGLYIWLTTTSRWMAVTAETDQARYRAARFFDYDNDGTFEIVATGQDKTCLLEHAEDGWHAITAQADIRAPSTRITSPSTATTVSVWTSARSSSQPGSRIVGPHSAGTMQSSSMHTDRHCGMSWSGSHSVQVAALM